MSKNVLTFFVLIIIFSFGLFVGSNLSEDIITEIHDTVFVEQPVEVLVQKATIVEKKVPEYIPVYFRDTLHINGKDTIFVHDTVRVAEADTCFVQGCLGVKYYFPPYSYFEYDWKPYPVPTIQTTITSDTKWYMKKGVWGFVGFVSGFYLGVQK